jgi:PHD/YefM family antitoxin component YafN of YafNO toxin-antitoxin module
MSNEATNSKEFREKLSQFFDTAIEKPVAINRGKDRFVLMSENEYLGLKDELVSLQRNLISLLGSSEFNETFSTSKEFINSLKKNSDTNKLSERSFKKG